MEHFLSFGDSERSQQLICLHYRLPQYQWFNHHLPQYQRVPSGSNNLMKQTKNGRLNMMRLLLNRKLDSKWKLETILIILQWTFWSCVQSYMETGSLCCQETCIWWKWNLNNRLCKGSRNNEVNSLLSSLSQNEQKNNQITSKCGDSIWCLFKTRKTTMYCYGIYWWYWINW